MQVGIMTTNGGPHSAEKWAIVTAGEIIQIAATATGTQAIEARKLENKIIDILEGHHDAVQKHEREKIAKLGNDRLKHPFDVSVHAIEAKADAIIAATKGGQFEAHFASSMVRDNLIQTLGQHFASSMDIERSWHADRNLKANPNCAVSKHYHKLRSEVGAGHIHAHVHTFPDHKPSPAA